MLALNQVLMLVQSTIIDGHLLCTILLQKMLRPDEYEKSKKKRKRSHTSRHEM